MTAGQRKSPRSWLLPAGAVAAAAIIFFTVRAITGRAVDVASYRFVSLDVVEPSAVAYHPRRNTLFVVSDEGGLAELDLAFKVKDRYPLPGDLEGVAVHPATGTLFVASESARAIYEYDLDARRILRTLVIDYPSHPDFARGVGGNKGVEGVTVVTTATGDYQLVVVNEAHPARLMFLDADVAPEATQEARQRGSDAPPATARTQTRIIASLNLGLSRLSDVMFEPSLNALVVVSAGEKVVAVYDLDGTWRRSLRIPGRKPEGLALLPDGTGLIVQDTGGMHVCDDLFSALSAEPHSAVTASRPFPGE